ncbi:DUF2065 domain-containing protein [Limibaculum sp. M0105]|uniref:DUF2065 domain-containing protein n=1 Tax=Thermohalobaculum xanthum TaxID=2753746 RepID=A0A8J7M9J3_9RHOB|nr:DUF2065 domain-containing protein [Thermohalobaculum xanthum]MBK0400829.1 DUF2065 domain-containing protein [Thermohalobaculum xanthum]
MDMLAALALVLVIEGLAIAIFSGSLPELLAAMRETTASQRRTLGIVMAVCGAVAYLAIRG